jgi:hypothetical protein
MQNATRLSSAEFEAKMREAGIAVTLDHTVTEAEAETIKRAFREMALGAPTLTSLPVGVSITDLRTGEVFIQDES